MIEIGFPGFDYMNKLLVVTIFPLVVVSALGVVYAAIVLRSRITGKPDKRGATVIYLFLFFTFLILVQCSSTVFDFFQCKTFPEALNEFGTRQEQKFLNRDYSVDCLSSRYDSFVPYGLTMIAVRPLLHFFYNYVLRLTSQVTRPQPASQVYPFGIPALYYTLVKKYSHILSDKAALEMEAAYNYPHVGHVIFLVEVCFSLFP